MPAAATCPAPAAPLLQLGQHRRPPLAQNPQLDRQPLLGRAPLQLPRPLGLLAPAPGSPLLQRLAPGSRPTHVPQFYVLLTTASLHGPQRNARARKTGGYGGRHRHCSPPPGLFPFTREEAFEAFVVRPALSKFRIRRPLINHADLPRLAPGSRPTHVPPFYGLLTTASLRGPQLNARAR